MTKFSSKILEKIRKENVTPKPRWYFVLMHTLLGTAILTSVMIGGIAVAIVIRHFSVTDWEMARQFSGSHLRSFFLIIPYIWLIFIGLTIFLADLLFKHTKKGYRIALWKMVAGSIGLSVLMGGAFYFVDVGRPIEKGIRENIPPYTQWEIMRNQMFASPEKGILAGEIIKIDSVNEWIIIDFKNEQWFVDTSEAHQPPRIEFKVGMLVGMIGEAMEAHHFKAIKIGPWRKEILLFPPPKIMAPEK